MSQRTQHVVQRPQRTDHDIPVDATDEERLLYTKRRKLLARADWLGLAPLKDISMRFTENTDHIGKRRKVESSTSRKGRPAASHPIAPLFHKPAADHEYMMSGALRPGEIDIKIGTDALASQMHPSQRSPTAGGATGRLASTDLASMSEEPMLLDDNENDFDLAMITGLGRDVPAAELSEHRSSRTMASSQHGQEIVYARESPLGHSSEEEAGDVLNADEIEPTAQVSHVQQSIEYTPQQQDYLPHLPLQDARIEHHDGVWEVHTLSERETAQPHSHHQQLQPQEEEKRWQHFFDIAQDSIGPRSLAVRRSSMGISSSSAEFCRAISPGVEHNNPEQDQSMNQQARGLRQSSNSGINPNEGLGGSDSASLKQIKRLAAAPQLRSRPGDDEVKYDALWRRFIIGSDDGSGNESEHFGDTPMRGEKNDESLEEARASPTLAISGLGTSAESTMGDTLLMNDSASSAELIADVYPQYRPDMRAESSNPASDVNVVSEAAGTLGSDEIEDVRWPEDLVTVPTNMHAISASRLDPRRFKPPPKKQRYVERANARRRKARKPVRREYSVYDLIDSDGNSLPG